MANSVYIFKPGEEIQAGNINYNFRFLLNYLSAIASDRVLIAELARSSTLADLIAAAFANDLGLMASIVDALNDSDTFFTNLITNMTSNTVFIDTLINSMIASESFMITLVETFSESVVNFDNRIADLLAEDTRGVNTRTDIGGSSASLGGDINYLATDSGTIRTKKSDETSTDAVDYSVNPIYDIDGSYWKVVVDAAGTGFEVWRYDTEADFITYGYTRADLHKAGPDGTVGAIFVTEQFLDTNKSIYKPNGIDKDKTTGRIYGYDHSNWSTLTTLPSGIEKIYSVSLRVVSTSPNEVFTFRTYNTNISDNGFVTNVAHAVSVNDTLTYEIGKRVLENPSFVTELSQNLQKVRINIQTEVMGNGSFGGQYEDLIMDQIKSGIVIDDNTARFELQPRLMDDGSGNFDIVNEPWVIGQIRVIPYIDTSNGMYPIEYVGNDPTDGLFISASGSVSVGIGNAVTTTDPVANTQAYVRDFVSFGNSGNIYLTNENATLPVLGSWSLLGWSEPTDTYNVRLIDTIDKEPNFDVKIYRKSIYSDESYKAIDNQYVLDDLRSFWYYPDESGTLFLEIKNNFGTGLGNPNKYFVDILGWRLIDRDINFSAIENNWITNEDLTGYVDGATTYFPTTYEFKIGTTKLINQHYPLRLGISGDSSSGDYYEVANKDAIVTFDPIVSGEWMVIDYILAP